MFFRKCWLILLLCVASTLLAHAEASEFAYRNGPAISLAGGGTAYSSLGLTSPNLALELGWGFDERILISADLTAIMPRIGVGVRYFPKSHDKIQPFANIGYGSLSSEEIFEETALPVSYFVATAGGGYQLNRWLICDLSLSATTFTAFGILDWRDFSGAAMLRIILW